MSELPYPPWYVPLVSPVENALNPAFVNATAFITISIIAAIGLFQLVKIRTSETTGVIEGSAKEPTLAHALKLYISVIQLILVAVLYVVARSSEHSYSLLLNALVLAFLILPLQIDEERRSRVPLASVLFYWVANIVFLGVSVVQDTVSDHPIVANNASILILEYITFLNAVPIFILEFAYYSPIHDFEQTDVLHVDIISYFTTTWFSPITKRIYETDSLKYEDLPNVAGGLGSATSFPILEGYWNLQKKRASAAKPSKQFWFFGKKVKAKPRLLPAILSTSFSTIFLAFILDIVGIFFQFASPYFLRKYLLFFAESIESPSVPIIRGYFLAVALFILKISGTLLKGQAGILNNKFTYFLDSSLSKLIFVKALKLSPQARKDKPTGDVINLATTDKSIAISLSKTVGEFVVIPTEIILTIYLLHGLIGNAVWGGLAAGLLSAPLFVYVLSFLTPVFMEMLKNKDERISLINEILVNIKSIKLHSWEDPTTKRVSAVRDGKELANLRKLGVLISILLFLFTNIPFFIILGSFVTFAHFYNVALTPDIVFPALVYLGFLTQSIIGLPAVLQQFFQSKASLDRLRDFLLLDELNLEESKSYTRRELKDSDADAVKISDATFLWAAEESSIPFKDEEEEVQETDKNIALKSIIFNAKVGALTCIVGKVGSGKTTFLKSILGEVPISEPAYSDDVEVSPSVEVYGSVAYCPQSPWILNASVRENILFGFEYEKDFYDKTVDACELLDDFKVLPDGDRTIVGEKGISLSGGQKVRIAVARAVYSRADVFLFDDILSAVDAHVGKAIAQKVLSKHGILGSRTKILATNSINVLHHSDSIVLLKSGTIAETGDYKTVVERKSDLAALLEEFGQNAPPDDLEGLELEKAVQEPLPKSKLVPNEYEYEFDEDPKTSKSGDSEEISETGSFKLSRIIDFLKASNPKFIVLFIVLSSLMQFGSIWQSYILAVWSELNSQNGYNTETVFYLGLYASIGAIQAVLIFAGYYGLWGHSIVKGASYYHAKVLEGVLRSPMSFFSTTPVGRILNRFTDDISTIDTSLPQSLISVFFTVISAVGALTVVIATLPVMTFVVIVLIALYEVYRRQYIPAKREFQRLSKTTKSPILANFQESINGVDTIKAFDLQGRFTFRLARTIDRNILVQFLSQFSSRWLNFRLQFIAANLVLFTTGFATTTLLTSNPLSPGILGFLLSQAIGITEYLSSIIDSWALIETQSVSLERLVEYIELTPEAPLIIESNRPAESWPEEGSVEFKNYSTRYRENLEPILKNINASIGAREKVGVVGRTGAGKSSLTLALFRIIEPIEGQIDIDSINTGKLGLKDLRTKLNIIPQESQLVRGSIRENLDPFQAYSDEELWQVLELAHLKEHIQQMTTKPTEAEIKASKTPDELPTLIGLDAKVDDTGSNLSAGQKQLLSLSRALLKKDAKVLVLDEATSSVDVETDKIVQTTIRSEFKDKTILTIAHRIDTILDSDRILVLDDGKVIEFDTPEVLLANKESSFYSLCKEGGYLK